MSPRSSTGLWCRSSIASILRRSVLREGVVLSSIGYPRVVTIVVVVLVVPVVVLRGCGVVLGKFMLRLNLLSTRGVHRFWLSICPGYRWLSRLSWICLGWVIGRLLYRPSVVCISWSLLIASVRPRLLIRGVILRN